MIKSFSICIVLCALLFVEGSSQLSTQQTGSAYVYYRPSEDKPSWQRLNLWLATYFYRGLKLNRIGYDSSFLHVSHALGISRLILAAEGIDDPELMRQSDWFDERNPGKGIQLLSRAKGKKKLELMILLGAYYAFQPNNYKLYRDSVEYFLKDAVTKSKNSNGKELGRVALCLLGKMYAIGADTVNAKAVFDQLINECRDAGDRKTEARAFDYRGWFTVYRADNVQRKVNDLQKAGEIYHELKDLEGEINAFSRVAFLDMVQYKLDDAYNGFVKALELEKSIGYPYTHYSSYFITILTMLQNKFGEPLKYALESIKVAGTVRDSMGLQEFYSQLGQLYHTEGGRSEESLKWMVKALDRSVAANGDNIYSNLYNVVGLMNEKSGREKEALDLVLNISKKNPPLAADEQIFYNVSLATCYKSLKQYALAGQHIAAADSIQKLFPVLSVADTYHKAVIKELLISVNLARGEYRTAKKSLEAFLADSLRVTTLSDELHTYQRLIYIDSVFDDAASGVKHYKQYTALLDSNFMVSKIRQAEELQVMYQTKEKQDSITLLHQQAKIEQVNLEQATLVKNLTIAGAILLMILLGLIYNRYRQKQKTNRILESQKEEINKNNQELQQLNEQQTKLLIEKDWLVKEIHHRVKNNLQMVVSLLNAQTEFLTHPSALDAIKESRERMQAIAIIHQKLYQLDNSTKVNMRSYINELIDNIKNSFADSERIHFKADVADIYLDISQSVPLGLILNEAITNSIKYAYPKTEGGLIQISFKYYDDDKLQLKIADNGKGVSNDVDIEHSNSLGIQLIRLFSEQLEGILYFKNNNGLEITLNFKATGYHEAALNKITA